MCSSEIKKRSSTHPGSELQLLLLEYSFGVLKSDPNQIKSRPLNRFRLIQLAPYFWFFRPALLITSRRQDGPRGSNHRQPYLSIIQTHQLWWRSFSSICYDDIESYSYMIWTWRFPKSWGYPQFSSNLWDFPWKPGPEGGDGGALPASHFLVDLARHIMDIIR